MTGSELDDLFSEIFEYKKIPIDNFHWNAEIIRSFDRAVSFMEKGNCLVHCIAVIKI